MTTMLSPFQGFAVMGDVFPGLRLKAFALGYWLLPRWGKEVGEQLSNDEFNQFHMCYQSRKAARRNSPASSEWNDKAIGL